MGFIAFWKLFIQTRASWHVTMNSGMYLAQVKFCGVRINDFKVGKRAKTKQISVLQIAGFHITLRALWLCLFFGCKQAFSVTSWQITLGAVAWEV